MFGLFKKKKSKKSDSEISAIPSPSTVLDQIIEIMKSHKDCYEFKHYSSLTIPVEMVFKYRNLKVISMYYVNNGKPSFFSVSVYINGGNLSKYLQCGPKYISFCSFVESVYSEKFNTHKAETVSGACKTLSGLM